MSGRKGLKMWEKGRERGGREGRKKTKIIGCKEKIKDRGGERWKEEG